MAERGLGRLRQTRCMYNLISRINMASPVGFSRGIVEAVLREYYSNLVQDLQVEKIVNLLFSKNLVNFELKEELVPKSGQSRSARNGMLLDHMIRSWTWESLETFCGILLESSKSESVPRHEEWATKLKIKLHQVRQLSSVQPAICGDQTSSTQAVESVPGRPVNPVSRSESNSDQAIPPAAGRSKIKKIVDMYWDGKGELRLPSCPKLEDAWDCLMMEVEKALLEAKPEKIKRVHTMIKRKYRRYTHGVRPYPLPDIPDSSEGLYHFIDSKSTPYEIFLVLHTLEELGNVQLRLDLEVYTSKLATHLSCTLLSFQHNKVHLPSNRDHTSLAVILTDEQVLLAVVLHLKEYFRTYLGLEEALFTGFADGCTTLFYSILRADAVFLGPKIVSHLAELQLKFGVTHVIVFEFFACDVKEQKIELLHEDVNKSLQGSSESAEIQAKEKEIEVLKHQLIATTNKLQLSKKEVEEGKVRYSDLLRQVIEQKEHKKSDWQEKETAILKVGIMTLRCFQQEEGVKLGKFIGEGTYGSVFAGTYNSRPVAIKQMHKILIDKYRECKDNLLSLLNQYKNQCNLLMASNSTFIVRILGIYSDTHQDGSLFLVMEKMDLTLEELLVTGKLPIARQMHISLQISCGLQFLHECKPQIVHGNITPKNIFIDKEGHVAKLGDSGQALFRPSLTSGSQPRIFPPEFLKEAKACFTAEGDIFCLGVNILWIAMQEAPSNLLHEITTASFVRYSRETGDLAKVDANHPLKPLILQCLVDKSEERPSASDVCASLSEYAPLKLYMEFNKTESKVFHTSLLVQGRKLQCKSLPNLLLPTCNTSAVVIGSKIFVGGGICHSDDDKEVTANARRIQVYDINSFTWDTLPPAPLYRSKVTTVLGQLTLIGGRNAFTKEISNLIYSWDEGEYKWVQHVPPMPTERVRPCIIHCKSFMLVAGGKAGDGKSLLDSIDVLNISTFQWDTLHSLKLPQPMYLMRTCISSGFLYISSGWSNISSMGATTAAYKISMHELEEALSSHHELNWLRIEDTPFLESALVVDSDQPLLVGGHKAQRSTPNVCLYDPSSNGWSVIGRCLNPCLRSCCIAISESVFLVIGGSPSQTAFKSPLLSIFQLIYV